MSEQKTDRNGREKKKREREVAKTELCFWCRELVVFENLILLLKPPFVVSELGDETLLGLLQLGNVLRRRLL